jgi:hypothetical protein
MSKPTLVYAVDHPELPPLKMPTRFRLEIVYFMTPAGLRNSPAKLPEGEYWIDAAEAKHWLDELVVSIVSPLDANSQADIELTEEQEEFLQWLVDHEVQHVRIA